MMRRCSITSSFLFVVSPTRALYPLASRRGHHSYLKNWLRRKDLNPRPLAYGASELPDCSTAQFFVCLLSKNGDIIAYIVGESQGQKIHPAVCGRQGVPLRRNEPAKNKIGTSPRRSQRNQLEFAAALASEDVSVGSMVAVILEWRRVSTTPK